LAATLFDLASGAGPEYSIEWGLRQVALERVSDDQETGNAGKAG